MNCNEEFKLLSCSEKTMNYIAKQLVNFPNREMVLKNNIEKTMYLLIESIFSYRIENVSRIKMKYLKNLLIQLSMLDYYMRISYQRKFISLKRYESTARFLLEIRKITYGVIRSEKSV